MIGLDWVHGRCGRAVVGACSGWLFSFALLTAGCSIINQTEGVQCSTNQDCVAGLGASVSYACVEQICAQVTCTTDDQCSGRGEGYEGAVCGAEGLCKSKVESACVTAADCNSTSPTMTCREGQCIDPWACVGELDDREPFIEPTATVEAKVLNLLTRQPAPAPTARACLLPTFDPGCTIPLTGTSSTYDAATGTLTMVGLPQDTPVRLKLDFPSEHGLAPIDHYSVRTPHDLTKFPMLTAVPLALASQLVSALDPPRTIEASKAAISAQVFDCENQPASGISFQIMESDRLPNTEVLYLAADGQLAPSAVTTDAGGSALIINAKTSRLMTLQAWLGGTMVKDYRIMAYPGRTTIVHLQPRVYRDRATTGS